MNSRVAICFLVVNKMNTLPEMAITSAYRRANSDVIVGYLDDSDLPILPKDVVIKPIRLENSIELAKSTTGNRYSDFSEDDFYKIVQLKWQLLEKSLNLGYEYVIYSDTDVYWNIDPTKELLKVFTNRPEVSVQIQSFTDEPSQPKLCMGFVAFRNSPTTKSFLEECRMNHGRHSLENGRIGDDDIVTQYFINHKWPIFIQELPQTTFPVGRMLKLFATKSIFPGLPSPKPYIFHANYVVGLRNKIILMKLFMRKYSEQDRNLPMGVSHNLVLSIQRARINISSLRKRLLNQSSK